MQLRNLAAVAAGLATLGLAAPPPVAAGDFERFPKQAAKPEAGELDAAQIEQLKELLRQAQELQKAQEEAKAAGAPAKAAASEDTADKKEAEPEEPEKKVVSQPGCMYRGKTLIWEKVPGGCAK